MAPRPGKQARGYFYLRTTDAQILERRYPIRTKKAAGMISPPLMYAPFRRSVRAMFLLLCGTIVRRLGVLLPASTAVESGAIGGKIGNEGEALFHLRRGRERR